MASYYFSPAKMPRPHYGGSRMAEIGAILLFVCLFFFGIIFLYFGADEKNPVFIVLGIAFFASILVAMGG